MNFVEPGYSVPSRTHVIPMFRMQYSSLRGELLDSLTAKYISTSTDIWTSRAIKAYITITAHYINDDWKLENKVLMTKGMPERHTGLNIAERVWETTKEWNIPDHLVSAIIHDNTSNMMTAIQDLGWNHLSCFAHTLQLGLNRYQQYLGYIILSKTFVYRVHVYVLTCIHCTGINV